MKRFNMEIYTGSPKVNLSVFFFFGHFVFFPRARVGLVKKKVTRNIEKEAHGLTIMIHCYNNDT